MNFTKQFVTDLIPPNLTGYTFADFDAIAAKSIVQHPPSTFWTWDGLIAAGEIALLTSHWKLGKSTLVAELLRAMGSGESFLGRSTRRGTVAVITEESLGLWLKRRQQKSIEGNIHFWVEPFRQHIPSIERLHDLFFAVRKVEPDLVIIDSLSTILPVGVESYGPEIANFLRFVSLQLPERSAKLILHHPRKASLVGLPDPRGSGILSSTVAILLDLLPYSRLAVDANRRRLRVRSRFPMAATELAYEYDPQTIQFTVINPPETQRSRDGLAIIRTILTANPDGLTMNDFRNHWPDGAILPDRTTLSRWLFRANRDGIITQTGDGKKPTRLCIG